MLKKTKEEAGLPDTIAAEAMPVAEAVEVETPPRIVEKKMGLTIYLQNYPQDSGIEVIMRLNYSLEIHTKTEWDEIVQQILGKKTAYRR